MTYGFPIKCTFWRGVLLAFVAVLAAIDVTAATLHRSFRMREAGVGFGAGAAKVAYPVDAKVAQALDEAAEKDATKVKVIVGKVSRVSDGDTIWVVGNQLPATNQPTTKYKVRLDRIDAPEKDQPYGKESTAYLSSLIRGKTVRVEWQKKDQYGRILGIVYATVPSPSSATGADQKPQDINLHLVATGNAWHYSYFDKTPAYSAAEFAAKEQKIGLWAAENPINPYEWRKSKRKM